MNAARRLDYAVSLGNLDGIRTGGTITVEIRTTPRPMSHVVGDVVAILRSFDELAQTGALAGGQLAPWDSGIDTVELATGEFISSTMHGCRVDERSMLVLAYWLQTARDNRDIASVAIGAPPFEALAQASWGPVYPALQCPPGFSIGRSSALSGEFRILVEIDRPWSDDEIAALSNRLATCATAISLGAYAVAPLDPLGGDCLFEPELEALDKETVAFHVTRFRADMAAVDALLATCLACAGELGISSCRLEVE